MGNARMALRRRGIIQPGPQVRAAAALDAEAKRVLRCEQSRIRQARRRARLAEEATEASRNVMQTPEGLEGTRMTERSSSRAANKLARVINEELKDCPTLECRRVIVEKLLNHNTFWPMMPEYYSRPQDAKSIFVFVESIRTEMQSVKNANSKVLLARKGALLDAAVSEGCDGSRALGRVLQVHPRNVIAAVSRRILGDPTNQFQLLERAKRPGVSAYVKEKVLLWWTQKTRVSPNKKDVTRKRIGRNEYDVHATHYLTDTQVSSLLTVHTPVLFLMSWLLLIIE